MSRWSAADVPDQTGRTALVTGANSGLGLHTSIGLARSGAHVLMGCRDEGRATAALAQVRAAAPQAQVDVVPLDLADLSSVEAAAAAVSARVRILDLLIDNAGVMAPPLGRTADGFELQLGINHLGHFALTGRLLPLLLAAPAPRVVAVSSGAHRVGRIAFDDLQSTRSYAPWRAYAQSKLANLLFIRELARRCSTTGLLACAAHPGYAATHLQTGQASRLARTAMRVGNAVIAQSDADGAMPSLYAATMPDVRPDDYWGPSFAELRGSPRRVGRSAAAQDDVTAGRLWTVSEDLTGVDYPTMA